MQPQNITFIKFNDLMFSQIIVWLAMVFTINYNLQMTLIWLFRYIDIMIYCFTTKYCRYWPLEDLGLILFILWTHTTILSNMLHEKPSNDLGTTTLVIWRKCYEVSSNIPNIFLFIQYMSEIRFLFFWIQKYKHFFR